jgi:iron complex transport system substrate-binding protein
MKIKSIKNIFILILLVVIGSACVPTQVIETPQPQAPSMTEIPPTEQPIVDPTDEPLIVVDDLGVEIVLASPPQKIISISPSLTEILFSVGAGERLIGRDSNSTFPEAALEATDLGGMWDGVPIEDILAMEPDLILAGEIYSADVINEMRDLGLTVYWQANPDSFEGLFDNIQDIALLTDTVDTANEKVLSLAERVNDLQGKLETVTEKPLVYYELDASDIANPWTTGSGTFISYVINQAKGNNLGDSLEGEWVQISSEELIAQDPDFILLADALYGVTPESLLDRPGWSEISAVAGNEVYPFDPFLLSVPGPRLVDGFEQLAEILHPEVFD